MTIDPRGFPTTLPDFQKVFPDDRACAAYLEQLRWPEIFCCPKCGTSGEPFRFKNRLGVLRCRFCRVDVSLTAQTVMDHTHTPLSTWFWAAYLITTQTPGESALQFQRQLGLSRYETAYQILHKLRSGMVRPDRDTIGGEHTVEVDETLIGGRTRGEGHGVHHKVYVIGAVEVRERKDGEDRSSEDSHDSHKDGIPLKKRTYAGRVRLQVIKDRKTATCERFIQENLRPDTRIKTDGWTGYDRLGELGWPHYGLALNADPELTQEHLPMIHLVFSNLKSWILGTHHGISQQHLQAYLNEYTFRFNRRFYPMTSFNSVLGLAAHAVPPTYNGLYSGEWKHPMT